ncbi:MAG: hypothetical protein IT558_02505 [Alphaproteobacteria bacterium]|nr:hypothetical protein [Alphaproteobacteria bacterium]
MCAVFAAFTAFAAETPWQEKAEIQVRLLGGKQVDKTLNLALEVKLEEGWHTYGEKPGDAGLPPRFDWAGSGNFEKAVISFPEPERFDEAGLTVYGYKDAVTFPLSVTLADAAKPAHLDLKFDIMVCKDICIPYTFDFALEVPPS